MNKKLPEDFSIELYGLHCRLVRVEDVDFILKLRTNPILSKYLHKTDNNRTFQIEWLSKYKLREAEGREYYFIFYKDSIPVALDRIYNINDIYATPGSWIIDPKYSSFEVVLATSFITCYIMFEILGIQMSIFEVRKGNEQVVKYHKLTGAKVFAESDILYFFYKTPQLYHDGLNKFSKFLE